MGVIQVRMRNYQNNVTSRKLAHVTISTTILLYRNISISDVMI